MQSVSPGEAKKARYSEDRNILVSKQEKNWVGDDRTRHGLFHTKGGRQQLIVGNGMMRLKDFFTRFLMHKVQSLTVHYQTKYFISKKQKGRKGEYFVGWRFLMLHEFKRERKGGMWRNVTHGMQ